MKKITLAVALIAILCNCGDDTPHRNTNPGFVAFDYTFQAIADYSKLFSYVYHLNEYMMQTSSVKRDSIDTRYFENVKISDHASYWKLRGVQSNFELQITTHGRSLTESGAKWDIVQTHSEPENKEFDFSVENMGDNAFRILRHSNKNQEFDIISEWIFKMDGENTSIEGSGYLLSIASPKLKLEYKITESLKVSDYHEGNGFRLENGVIEIDATDMERQITEKTVAEILSDRRVEISYNGYRDIWDYYVRFYP